MARRDVSRTKLFRMVQSCDFYDEKFRPTIQDCRETFRSINRSIFNNELKMPKFRLVYSKEFWGECTGDLTDSNNVLIKMNKSFISRRLFINTLAHEMVHQWEWLYYENMTHGKTFFVWRDMLSKFNITLSRHYRAKHYRLD